jgi:hypothetical protein
VPVDYDLVKTSQGWTPAASTVPVVFSAGGSGPLVRFGSGADATELGWVSAVPAPTIAGASATYALDASTSLVLRATASGFEQSLVLAKKPANAPRVTLGFANGLILRAAAAGGGFELARPGANGKRVFAVPAPVMYSAQVDPVTGDHTQVADLTATVGTAADGTPTLDVSAAASTAMSFLNDPATQYPVTIDPVVAAVAPLSDTYVTTENQSNHSTDYDLRVGRTTLGNTRRALLRFAAGSSLAGMHVTAATLRLYEIDAGSCTAQPIKAYPVTQSWIRRR